ncbi:hypothetical protein EC968_002268 [Mortierella alpina]|nr:hypothetical protein EC968_002268 [Mortierella alpina]
MTALIRNLGHIRNVVSACLDQSQLQLLVQGLPNQLGDPIIEPGTLSTNLTRMDLDVDFCNLDLISKPLVKLLHHNTRLTYLHVCCDIFEIDGVAEALSQLRHLQHLSIEANYVPIFPEPLVFLRSCLVLPELTELIIDIEMRWYNGDEAITIQEFAATISEATATRFSQNTKAKKIKSLHLPTVEDESRNPLPLLLLRSELLDLETCVIPRFGVAADLREIEQVVRERCLNLKQIECPSSLREGEGPAIRAFIRGCSGLQTFTAISFEDYYDNEPLLILSELVRRHHATLEVFDIYSPQCASSRDLQEVLSRCRQLKRFWLHTNRFSVSSISYRDMSMSDWVCTELRELRLELDRSRPEIDEFNELEEGDEEEEEGLDDPHACLDSCSCAPKRAFRNIGRLHRLEVLIIGIDTSYRARATEADYAWDLTLSKGWLGELAGLRNLKRLHLRADFWRAMGQAEVEFMYEHWPLLSEIAIWCHPSLFRIDPHWQWLLDKRPQLRFAALS